jgi:hypothetical protein
MASTVKHLRSSTADKRPTASGLADGQLAINTASGTPGLFLKDNAGAVVKVGPVHVGAVAPNATPAGSSGNSKGELWVNDTTTIHGLNYYTGSAFVNLTPSGTATTAGLVELATNAETQAGTDTIRAVTPSGLQSKVSDSTSTTSSTTIASSTAVKAAFDLANAALPKSGGRVTGNLEIGPTGSLSFEGSTDDSFETFLAVVNPTADRTITFPNVTGTVITTGDTGTVTSTMITDGTIVNADINASAGIVDTKLATISTAGKVSNSATTAVSTNTVNAIVARDGSGNFSAGTITAALTGNASTATKLSSARTFAVTGDITGTVSSDLTSGASIATSIAAGVIVDADVNASAAIGLSKLATGALPSGITVASANIVDGTIVNADVNASAAIAGTKIAPNFGSQTITTTGIISPALGTAAAPSIAFTGDLNTGIYSPGADQVAVATNGSGRLFINSTGQVGIGTSAPDTLLHLSSATGSSTPTPTELRIATTTNASNWSSTDPWGRISFYSADVSGGGPKAHAAIGVIKTGSSGASSNISFQIDQDGAGLVERMRIVANGRVGIGTTSPNELLEVAGNIHLSGADRSIFNRSNNALTFGTNDAERARIDSSGRLLVGTSTALTSFVGATLTATPTFQNAGTDGNNSSASFTRLSGTGLGPTLVLQRGSSGNVPGIDTQLGVLAFNGFDGSDYRTAAQITVRTDAATGSGDMPGRIEFATTADGSTSPTERMRIGENGNVRINSSVDSPGSASEPDSPGFGYAENLLYLSRGSGAALNVNRFTNDGAAVVFRRAGGNVGTISVTTTNTAYNTSSDYRLKENVVDLDGAIDRLKQLPVHRFNFIADPDTVVDGFIAHEAAEVVPECVTGTKDEVDEDGNPVYQGIDQSKMVPLLTAALQEAIAKIETLEQRLTVAGIN